jgi:hypothetical protein
VRYKLMIRGSAQTVIATSVATQAVQMENPSAGAIWSRAIEIFEGEEQEYADSGDAEKQREVLTILARLDYGMFS